ncbi:ATP synthase F1 subunit gamma [Mycoplasmopsis agassizii]|uniref:ATP synthase F1 subunit gamma n=1 Tax=Mycoplasmopsis agassizii TaxID=33922 RepID=UPI00352913D4
MANLQKISQRIHLVGNIKKITNAMELISAAKLRKTQKHHLKIKTYADSVEEMFNEVQIRLKDTLAKDFYPANPKNSTLFIVITSNLGLAGSYNADVFKKLNSQISEFDKLIIFGNKGINYFSGKKYEVVKEYHSVNDLINYEPIQDAISKAIALFLKGEIKQINLVYTKFINAVTNEVTLKTLFPIDFTNLSESKKTELAFEPSPLSVFKIALPIYLGSIVFEKIAESKVAEMATRRIAMENSTNNAQELITNLKMDYNKTRQSKITQEIAEIVAGNLT